jgi:hypothetical protein
MESERKTREETGMKGREEVTPRKNEREALQRFQSEIFFFFCTSGSNY